MKKRLRSVLTCFLLTFFAYFRYLQLAAGLLLIGSIFFHPLLYAALLVIGLDAICSLFLTWQITMVVPGGKTTFLFQPFGTDLSDPSERTDSFDYEYHE